MTNEHSECNKGKTYYLESREYFYCNSCQHYVLTIY